VYSPQILENYRLKSGEGLSVGFVFVWLLGDIFNLAGALMAGLLPTVIILAVYVSSMFVHAVLGILPSYACSTPHVT
jgi:hypothetical protein